MDKHPQYSEYCTLCMHGLYSVHTALYSWDTIQILHHRSHLGELNLSLSPFFSLSHTFFHIPPYLHPQSLPPSPPALPPSLPPSLVSLFAVAKGRVRRLEYVDGFSSAREPPAFALCRGKKDHRGENRSVWACV